MQRDLSRTVFRWYLAPLIPGLTLFWGSAALRAPQSKLVFVAGFALFTAAVLIAIWAMNRGAAMRLQHKIDNLDRRHGL